ncbi:MAG: carboxypeptidase regulatory-like domain-containing protein [Candidatus Coatesbacteria bacterium]|nr:MAG: carboxypeptidase regulatory-like domain-containing protein [Candidatus Coatesbacteria bacterium]
MKYIKIGIYVAAFALLVGCSTDLLEGTVEGIRVTVVAGDGPTPVYNANITVKGETENFNAQKRSSVDGTVSFGGIPDGDYSLAAESASGVIIGNMRVNVYDGRSADGLYFQLSTKADGARVLMVDGTYDRVGDTMERLGYLYTTVDAADLTDPNTFAAADVLILNSGCDENPAEDQAVVDNLRDFVNGGGRLIVSGRANDYIDAVWSNAITYIDGATGNGLQKTTVSFDNGDLNSYMLGNDITVKYDIEGFPVMTGTTGVVLASGDVKHSGGTAAGAPVAVSFARGSGMVTYTNFAWFEQDDAEDAARRLLNYIIANR